MSRSSGANWASGVVCGLVLVVVLFLVGLFYWYRAEVQRKVYEREGVHMDTWEILWGARPVERTLTQPAVIPGK